MEKRYIVEYKETQEALTRVCELFNFDNSDISVKVMSLVLGPVVLAIMSMDGKFSHMSSMELSMFGLKFVAGWVAVFAVAMVINRVLWRKMVLVMSVGDAEEQFKRRQSKIGDHIVNHIDFYEDRFDHGISNKKTTFYYEHVTRFVETERAFSLVIKSQKYLFWAPKAMIGFPKDAVVDADIESLKTFLMERCSNAKKRVKTFK